MKLTIPHLGNTYIAAKALFEGLGVDYVIPPLTNAKALEIGSLHSPEEICLPFKLMIGNYMQSIEAGADTVILPGSCGPCRFGEYCELQMGLMNKISNSIEFIVIDSPKDIGKEELLKRVARISAESKKTKPEKIKTLIDAYKIMKLLDYIEAKARALAGYEKKKGEFKKLLTECKQAAFIAQKPNEVLSVLNNYKAKIKQIELDIHKNPLKIAIIGEIYTIIEPFSNLYIEDKLMDYGVCTKRRLTPSWWVSDMLLSTVKLNSIAIRRASKEYIPLCIGGHAVECIGEAVLAQKEEFDGIIQIFPLGCMPEIVAKAILPTISKEKNIPILTLVVDEMTGEVGYYTRIEAFLDLLERRKKCII
jgi:predicted nucleotide-binding protein (sugar kinase/HSP70/actin superfamily)